MDNNNIERWITVKGNHIPIEKGQSGQEAIDNRFKATTPDDKSRELYVKQMNDKSIDELKKEVSVEVNKQPMTAEEKIKSVHIDLDKDNILPELNYDEIKKIGVTKSKLVLLKKDVIDRNFLKHNDLTEEDFVKIISNALYSPSEVFPANQQKPYFHFAKIMGLSSKGRTKYGLTLLDVEESNDMFEIVHVYYVDDKGYNRAKNK